MNNNVLNQDVGLHPMKKIEIVVLGEYEKMVAELLEQSNIHGFTLIRNVSGKGHTGFHEGSLLYNDKSTQVMFMAVANEKAIADIARKMRAIFENQSGVLFVSDVFVSRLHYFSQED
jgi:nitrogen regulatory protein PII